MSTHPTIDVSALLESAGTRDVNPGNDAWPKRQRLIACIDYQTQTVHVEVENDVPGGGFASSSMALCDVPGNLEPAALRMLADYIVTRKLSLLIHSTHPVMVLDNVGDEIFAWLEDNAPNLPARIDAHEWCGEGIHDDVLNCGTVDEVVALIEGGADHALRGTRQFVTCWIEDQLRVYDDEVEAGTDAVDLDSAEVDHYRRVLAA